jgi:hypothetical protein
LQQLQTKVVCSAYGFKHSERIRLHNKYVKATTEVPENHDNQLVSSIEQSEARHRKYKRLQFVVVTLLDSCEVQTESRFHFIVVT